MLVNVTIESANVHVPVHDKKNVAVLRLELEL